jgi:hypothetical protein
MIRLRDLEVDALKELRPAKGLSSPKAIIGGLTQRQRAGIYGQSDSAVVQERGGR